MVAVKKSNDGSAATADVEDDKNEAAGHDEESTCNNTCPPVRPGPKLAVAEEETADYATDSLTYPTIEEVIVEEEKELALDDKKEDAPAVAAEALASPASPVASRFHESAEDEQASATEEAEEVEPPVEADEEEDAATAEEEVGPAEVELEASSRVICSCLTQLFYCKIMRK